MIDASMKLSMINLFELITISTVVIIMLTIVIGKKILFKLSSNDVIHMNTIVIMQHF